MRFLFIGAGGIGAYYGARLVTAGHDVCFVARGDHLEAIRRDGLCVRHPEFLFQQRVDVVDQEQLITNRHAADFDLIVLTLKSVGTKQLMRSLEPWLGQSDVPLLSLQNGVNNEWIIESIIGTERTVGGLAVRIGGHIIEPGVIEATGVAQVVMGAWKNAAANAPLQARLEPLAALLREAGIPVELSADIQRELWRKLLINNGVNPLSALTRRDTRSLTADPVLTRTVYQLMEEAALAASADGVVLERSDIDEMYQLICRFDAIKTSMLVDLEKGRPLELDAISGAVIERCERLGKEAPLTALIGSLLRAHCNEMAAAC